jgi:hypothetical protein
MIHRYLKNWMLHLNKQGTAVYNQTSVNKARAAPRSVAFLKIFNYIVDFEGYDLLKRSKERRLF